MYVLVYLIVHFFGSSHMNDSNQLKRLSPLSPQAVNTCSLCYPLHYMELLQYCEQQTLPFVAIQSCALIQLGVSFL